MDNYIEYWQLWHHNWDGEDLAIIQRLGDLANKDVLEIGCGDGRLTFPLASQCKRIIGVDYEQRFIELAAAKTATSGLTNISFLHMDAQSLNFPDEQFDLVLMPWVLQMVPEQDLAMREAKRVLRPGGKLIVVALESGSDYDHLIALFADAGRIDNAKTYQEPLKEAFGDFQTIEESYPFRYFFKDLETAQDAFRFAFKRWYKHDLLDAEVAAIKNELAKFAEPDERIAIKFPASVYSAVKA